MLLCSLFYPNPVLHSIGAQTSTMQRYLTARKKQLQCPYIIHTYCTYAIYDHQLGYSPPLLAEYYSMYAPKKAAYGDFQKPDYHFYGKLK